MALRLKNLTLLRLTLLRPAQSADPPDGLGAAASLARQVR